ncbi:MAG: hypothetical protein ACREA0_03045, partial [bacterium]
SSEAPSFLELPSERRYRPGFSPLTDFGSGLTLTPTYLARSPQEVMSEGRRTGLCKPSQRGSPGAMTRKREMWP